MINSMFSTRTFFQSLCGCLLLAPWMALLGCGGESGPVLVPVAGTVTVDGKPIPGAGVSFRADAGKGNTTGHAPAATADAQGKYEVTVGPRKGAPPGWYKVVVSAPVPPKSGGDAPAPVAVPFAAKYTDPNTTDLSIEVKAGAAPGAYDLKLSP
jgi:hypothetical protein